MLYPPRGVATLADDMVATTTQFWTSNIVEALIHIHNQGVAYRDLKPENLLVNEQVWWSCGIVLLWYGGMVVWWYSPYATHGSPHPARYTTHRARGTRHGTYDI